MNKYFATLIFCLAAGNIAAQETITSESLMNHVRYLASDSLEGRLPGSTGNRLAADHIRAAFRNAGIQPLYPGYSQPFPLTLKLDALPANENYLLLPPHQPAVMNKEYSIYPFSGSGSLEKPMASAAGNEIIWAHAAQIKGYWWMLHKQKTGVPSTDSLSDYVLAKKAMQLGAGGVLFVCPDSLDKDKKDVLVRLRPRKDSSLHIPVLQVKKAVGEMLQQELTRVIDNVSITVHPVKASVHIIPEKITAENIAGIIEGSDPVLKKEYIIIGAHYDHLGYGGYGSGSLKPDTTAIHNGADDNASGTATLLELAKALALHRDSLKRSIILVAFSGEEEGLIGSAYFAQHLPVSKSAVKIMLNMDMVGSVNEHNNLYMGGAGTFPGGVELMKQQDSCGLSVVVNAGDVGGTDHVSFYQEHIPCIGFHTGGTKAYHTPEDDAVLINAKGMEMVAHYIFRTVIVLARRTESWEFIKQN